MKGKLKLISLLIILFVVFILIRLIVDVLNKKQGRLRIVSKPSAAIFVEDIMRGKTPFEDALKEGMYKVKLIPDNAATQAASWQKKVSILANTVTYIDAQLEPTDIASSVDVYWFSQKGNPWFQTNTGLVVETEPAGALIYIDTDEKGISPLTLDSLSPGAHELSVFMPGFVRRTKKINIPSGLILNAFVKLALDPSQAPRYKIENITPTPTPLEQTQTKIVILDTPTGWLRVRETPSLSASESARVNPGDTFSLLEEQEGWYQIKVSDKTAGWISSEYAKKEE